MVVFLYVVSIFCLIAAISERKDFMRMISFGLFSLTAFLIAFFGS